MATQTASSSFSSSSSSSSSSSQKYDVFLSFCGVDTRKNFTDHLYTALKQKGIITFRDDEKLERGKYISDKLLNAIKKSDYAIVVLSENYAYSKWCLIELAQIVECRKNTRLIVFPVFYHVDPSHVRNQTGTFAEAFTEHEKNPEVKIDKMQEWKAALIEVGHTAGWHIDDSYESKVIEDLVGKILGHLASKYSFVLKDLVGINSRMEELVDLLGMGLDDIRFIGIWGMGGMGKTTLAKVVYDRFRYHFEGSSFLANVREESGKLGLVSLQKQLFSDLLNDRSIILKRLRHKKVLIILDDVDQPDQLEALVGERSWFGQGSRIIITTRDRHLLIGHKVPEAQIYKVKELNNDESLKLFSQNALKGDPPLAAYVELSQKFIYYAKGLPLALKVLGSFLYGKKPILWESALVRCKENSQKKILDMLEISIDGLEEREKSIYLDIACFFNGMDIDYVTKILQILYHKPDIDIDVLLKKALITISRGNFQMHDLLQELGRKIVYRESPQEAGERSRLWRSEDVLHVLKENTGTKSVKGIFLESRPKTEKHLNVEAFSKMKNLRLLKISNVRFPQGLNYLSRELRSIHWDGYPLEVMPTRFEPEKLVELIMHRSLIKQLWKGVKSCDELKLIDLSFSKNLIEIPDLSGVRNLEQLILQGCTSLSKIHASLGNLKLLIRLDLDGCKCLVSLPHKISLKALETFILSGCSRLKEFPEVVGNMSCLSKLSLNETAIKDLPLSIENLIGLTELDLRDCKNLSSLPNGCYSSMSLKILNLFGCSKLHELPENLGNIKTLEELDVSGTAIIGLPLSVVHLKNLKVLSLAGCVGLFPLRQPRRSLNPLGMLECSLIKLDLSYCNLRKVPNVIGCFPSLIELNLRGNNFVCLPESIVQLSNLRGLYLGGCTNLQMLPKLPLNIECIDLIQCASLETISLRPEPGFQATFYLLNCDKLIKNQGGSGPFSAMLRLFITTLKDSIHPNDQKNDRSLWIPRSEIPKWFSHQNVEDSVSLQVPSDLLLGNEKMGIAVCVAFRFGQCHQLHQLHIKNYAYFLWLHELCCSVRVI